MAASSFRVVFTHSAFADVDEIVTCWSNRGEPERGEQYARDLPAEAIRRLGEVQELFVFKRSYRVLYRIRESENTVEVLRFWHSHREEPFRDA
jgi:plasmid stabilization system protein ParE